MFLTILGILLGFAVGIGLRFVTVSADALMWLGKFGMFVFHLKDIGVYYEKRIIPVSDPFNPEVATMCPKARHITPHWPNGQHV